MLLDKSQRPKKKVEAVILVDGVQQWSGTLSEMSETFDQEVGRHSGRMELRTLQPDGEWRTTRRRC